MCGFTSIRMKDSRSPMTICCPRCISCHNPALVTKPSRPTMASMSPFMLVTAGVSWYRTDSCRVICSNGFDDMSLGPHASLRSGGRCLASSSSKSSSHAPRIILLRSPVWSHLACSPAFGARGFIGLSLNMLEPQVTW